LESGRRRAVRSSPALVAKDLRQLGLGLGRQRAAARHRELARAPARGGHGARVGAGREQQARDERASTLGRDVQRRVAGVRARVDVRAVPQQRLDHRRVPGFDGGQQRVRVWRRPDRGRPRADAPAPREQQVN
jgi:hypothetical protein